MKRVLIVTYYWPPSGGGGVQRWLKFVKYLRNFDWEPVIYTPENPEGPVEDKTLLKDVPKNIEVIKRPIKEQMNGEVLMKTEDSRLGAFRQFSKQIRGSKKHLIGRHLTAGRREHRWAAWY